MEKDREKEKNRWSRASEMYKTINHSDTQKKQR